MKLTPQHIRDLSAVMGVEAEMVPLLGRLRYPDRMLNPWSRVLRGELVHLGLGPHSRVLDLACGAGGVSVLVAREFGARVRGVDLLPEHVAQAEAFAEREGLAGRCEFAVADIRDVVDTERDYDALLWIAAPPIWTEAADLIRALRSCVRPGGTVFVAEAYRPLEIPEAWCPGVATLEEATTGFGCEGDTVTFVPDPPIDWARDNDIAQEVAEMLLAELTRPVERAVVERHLAALRDAETREAEELGTAFWNIVRRDDRAS